MSSSVPVNLAFTYIETDGCITDKPPIIFLHGVTASKEVWYDIPEKVARETKRKVYKVDARNHGDSEWSDVFDFSVVLDDLLHFLDNMNIHKAVLVGQSMGGLTAMRAACKQPARFEKIVVEDIGVKNIPPEIFDEIPYCMNLGFKALESVSESADEVSGRKFIGEFVHKSFPLELQGNTTPAKLECAFHLKRDSAGRLVFKNNLKAIVHAMKLQKERKVDPQPETYTGPAYFIYGKNSPFKVGDQMDDIRQNFPNAEFIGIDGARHSVHLDQKAEFENALLKFLKRC